MAAETAEQVLYVSLDVPRGQPRLCPSVPCFSGSAKFCVRICRFADVANTSAKGGESVDLFR